MSLKCIKNLVKDIPDMSPKERGPIPRRFRAQMRGEQSPKATQTNSTLHNTVMGQI
jgi:hypothetical protein